ncbi:hypothetical protein B0H17DRAFT_1338364 [Mycena rosella]|uniref:Uncharacterized protein n=1 Tax=Mycena rosella TaxID=1033263 RepID=A0AAD7CMS2_MYCRO|nr:hypothetical protein B0H17DRAFT_1338364 [Mycena rosella]
MKLGRFLFLGAQGNAREQARIRLSRTAPRAGHTPYFESMLLERIRPIGASLPPPTPTRIFDVLVTHDVRSRPRAFSPPLTAGPHRPLSSPAHPAQMPSRPKYNDIITTIPPSDARSAKTTLPDAHPSRLFSPNLAARSVSLGNTRANAPGMRAACWPYYHAGRIGPIVYPQGSVPFSLLSIPGEGTYARCSVHGRTVALPQPAAARPPSIPSPHSPIPLSPAPIQPSPRPPSPHTRRKYAPREKDVKITVVQRLFNQTHLQSTTAKASRLRSHALLLLLLLLLRPAFCVLRPAFWAPVQAAPDSSSSPAF